MFQRNEECVDMILSCSGCYCYLNNDDLYLTLSKDLTDFAICGYSREIGRIRKHLTCKLQPAGTVYIDFI